MQPSLVNEEGKPDLLAADLTAVYPAAPSIQHSQCLDSGAFDRNSMINIFVTRKNRYPLRRLLDTWPPFARILRPVCYDLLFARQVVPPGTCIFTDFDLLNTYEVDAAYRAAAAAQARGSRVLNWPNRVAERFELLRLLRSAGLNPVEVTRLDDRLEPTRYPVFLRGEDGSFGPETGLLRDEAAFREAVAALRASGKTLKRRIAVSFEAEQDRDGFFRKYGAFVVGARIVPQHILRRRDWNVKSAGTERDRAFVDEEFAYVRDNPHGDRLAMLAKMAGIEFGRIDYTITVGVITIFEINTNPTFPRFSGGDVRRGERRQIIRDRLAEAFAAVNEDGVERGPAVFDIGSAPGFHVAIARARWHEDLPYSLVDRHRWDWLRARLLRSNKEHG